MVDEEMIKAMHGGEILLTVDTFNEINKDKFVLRRYRENLKHIRPFLKAAALGRRKFIPTTFDGMMVDFGTTAERKAFIKDFNEV